MNFKASGAIAGALLLLLTATFSALPVPALAVTPYSYGALPSNANDADMNSAYATWKSRRLDTSPSCGTRVDNGLGYTYSEGMAYGALMAAYLEPNDTLLKDLWDFYAANMDPRGVMNWSVAGNSCGNNGSNAATDADLDVAAALIRASRRWPASPNNWSAKAQTLLNNIYNNMVDPCFGIKNGDTWGGCTSGANNAYNPSYFRTGYMQSFDCFQGTTRWNVVKNRSYTVANYAYVNYALPPDWVRSDGTWGQPTNSGGYGYDSCRSPWTFAQDYLWWNNTNGRNWASKMARVFGNQAAWGSPATAAANTGNDYNYNNGAKVGFLKDNAFLGGAAVAFMATTYSAHATAFYNELIFNDDNTYYSDSLKVIYLMILTGTFQEPCLGGGPAPTLTPTPTPTLYNGTPTVTQTPNYGQVFENFETGITGAYNYAGSTSSLTYSRIAAAAHTGAYGDRMVVNVGGAQPWAGMGFDSMYAAGNGVIDNTGATAMRFWIKSDKNITIQASWKEGAVAGGEREAWISINQNITAAGGWQQVVLSIPVLTEDPNNPDCPVTPAGCLTAGNGGNDKDLPSTKTFQIGFVTAVSATVDIDDIEFVLAVAPTATSTKTPFIGSYNQVFDDIEAPLSLSRTANPSMAGVYANTAQGATATVASQSSMIPSGGGTKAGLITYNSGGATSYGAGAFLLSPYAGPGAYVDAAGAVFLGMWINAAAGTQFRLAYQEAGIPTSPTAGADGEAWESSVVTANGGWEFIQLETGAFNEDLYNPNCNPSSLAPPGPCSTGPLAGNGIRDYQAISSVSIKLLGNQGSGNFYFDDVVFVTSFKSPTPTRTPSASPSFSRTPSPTYSASATQTVAITPTNTVTPSSSRTPSSSASPSSSATPQGSSTSTGTITPSASSSATPTETVYQSPSATPTATDYAGSPTSTGTVTPSSSSTAVLTSTHTATTTNTIIPPSPSFTSTITPSSTVAVGTFTSTYTATPSNTVVVSSFTFTATPSNTAVLPSATRTATPSFTQSSTVVVGSFTRTTTPTSTHTSTPSFTSTSTPAAASAMITDLAFAWTPNQITVSAGTNVTWAWVGTHDVRSDTSLFSSGAAVAGGSFNFTFNTPGTYRYYCSLHGAPGGLGMAGIIFVTGAVTPMPTATLAPSTGDSGPIVSTQAAPNPNPGAVMVQLNRPVDKLTLKIYTKAMVAIYELSSGPSNTGWCKVPLPTEFVKSAESGTYYYTITAEKNGSTSRLHGTGHIVVIR